MIDLSKLIDALMPKLIAWGFPLIFTWVFTKLIKEPILTYSKAMKEEKNKPLEEIKAMLVKQGNDISEIKKWQKNIEEIETISKECDLSDLDDHICSHIHRCLERGYTSESERRRVTRMHNAYRARGGNHGEEKEFALFEKLPTEEEFKRKRKQKQFSEENYEDV